jgi:hypothetical protein
VNTRLFKGITTLLLCFLAACIGVPIKAPPGEKPFKEDFMSFVSIGETTRDEIRAKFSAYEINPKLTRFENDSVWVYSASRDTWQWFLCAGAGYSAACDVVGGIRDHFLKFEFDDSGRVIHWETSSTLGECAAGVCEDGGAFMAFANAEQDQRAKRDDAPDHCQVYVFATLPRAAKQEVVGVWIDDRFVGAFLNDDGYVFETLEPGMHRVKTNQSSGTYLDTFEGRNTQSLRWECVAGRRYFIHHNCRHKEKGSRRFMLEIEDDAQEGIAKRRLILRPMTIATVARYELSPSSQFSRQEIEKIVWQMQLRLKELGFYEGDIDGELTSETKAAILEFKRQNGLYGESVLDDDTLDALGVNAS